MINVRSISLRILWRLLMTGLVCSALVPSWSFAGSVTGTGDPSSADASANPGNIGERVQHAPPAFDPALLELGQRIYDNLKRARLAVLDRNRVMLKMAVDEARDDLALVKRPPGHYALREALIIIHHDLRETGQAVDATLWVPLEIEIDEALQHTSDQRREAAHAAVSAGRQFAVQGNREGAANSLDEVASIVRYSVGIFPFREVNDAFDAANAAVDRTEPDWQSALVALQRAMASVHWYTQVPFPDLVSAYNQVVDAYTILLGREVKADQQQRVVDALTTARSTLDASGESALLVNEISDLIRQGSLQIGDLRMLLGHLQAEIDLQQAEARQRYWDSLVR